MFQSHQVPTAHRSGKSDLQMAFYILFSEAYNQNIHIFFMGWNTCTTTEGFLNQKALEIMAGKVDE